MIRRLILACAVLYTLGYITWRVLLLLPAQRQPWSLQLSEVVGSWLYLPLALLISLAVLARVRHAALILLVPLCFFSMEYGRQWLPKWQSLQPAPNEAAMLRVMTWNSRYTLDTDGEFSTLANTLHPDLIALQEVSFSMGRRLAEDYRQAYPYVTVYGSGSRESLALLSRFPILGSERDHRVAGCQCLRVALDVHGRVVTVLVVHVQRPRIILIPTPGLPRMVDFNTDHQGPIFDALIEAVQATDGPLLVMGDFNTTERQPNLRRLQRLLANAYAVAGWGMGYTYPIDPKRCGSHLPPLVRIDHILYNDSWRARAAWTGVLADSDHAYVVADLEFSPNAYFPASSSSMMRSTS
jgi:endonuclease/exonuclease/phosphatase (EEP) superfamily protein YafD